MAQYLYETIKTNHLISSTIFFKMIDNKLALNSPFNYFKISKIFDVSIL